MDRTPKSPSRGPSVRLALAHFTRRAQGSVIQLTAKWLCEAFGEIPVASLGTPHTALMNEWAARFAPRTRFKRLGGLRQALRHLVTRYGAAWHLPDDIERVAKPKPRNVTTTAGERAALLANASERMRCYLLLCSDLAIRSGTAVTLGPRHYNAAAGELTFTTKYQATVRLPVTAELAALLDTCQDADIPFVGQLRSQWSNGTTTWRPKAAKGGPVGAVVMNAEFRRLKQACKLRADLRPHDLRRTTARRVYDATRDLRLVQALLGHSDLQSTLWYLQDSLTTVPVSTLELAKLPPVTERPQ